MAASERGTPERLLEVAKQLVEKTPGAHWVATETDKGSIVETPWVAYGPGFEIPLVFEYVGTGPFDWKVLVCVIEGRPQSVRLECSTVDPRRPITPEALHRFQLGRFLEEATLMASRPVDEVPRRSQRWANVEEVRAARAEVAKRYKKRPDGHRRQVLTDEFLVEVANVYRDHVATGKPSKAVAERFHYTDASARRVVREARLRGFLGPARPGRGGEQHEQEDNDA